MSTNPIQTIMLAAMEETRHYHQALGAFIEAFARVEANLQLALWHYAKVPTPTARAIFSGVRIETGMQFINRICEVNDPGAAEKSDLESVFKQLSIINKVRNNIIHYGAHPTQCTIEAVIASATSAEPTKLTVIARQC